jgi:hypothetical protein
VVLAHALVFFIPPTKLAKASSYRAVLAIDRLTTNAITAIRDLHGRQPITIVHYGSPVSSRHLTYYFPDDYVVVLPVNPGEGRLEFYRHQAMPLPDEAAGLIYPGSHRIVLVGTAPNGLKDLPGWRNYHGVYYLDQFQSADLLIGSHRLIPQR